MYFIKSHPKFLKLDLTLVYPVVTFLYYTQFTLWVGFFHFSWKCSTSCLIEVQWNFLFVSKYLQRRSRTLVFPRGGREYISSEIILGTRGIFLNQTINNQVNITIIMLEFLKTTRYLLPWNIDIIPVSILVESPNPSKACIPAWDRWHCVVVVTINNVTWFSQCCHCLMLMLYCMILM